MMRSDTIEQIFSAAVVPTGHNLEAPIWDYISDRYLDELLNEDTESSLDQFFLNWRPANAKNRLNPELWYLTALFMMRNDSEIIAELAIERMLSLGTTRPHHLAKAASFYSRNNQEEFASRLWSLLETMDMGGKI